jgi:hypothetical protein
VVRTPTAAGNDAHNHAQAYAVDTHVPTSMMINVSVAFIAMAMTTITMVIMVTAKADRAEANANPVAIIRRKPDPEPSSMALRFDDTKDYPGPASSFCDCLPKTVQYSQMRLLKRKCAHVRGCLTWTILPGGQKSE